MNLIAFMSFIILVITILTLVFGVIAYFLYKARERKKKVKVLTYEDALKMDGEKFLFFQD